MTAQEYYETHLKCKVNINVNGQLLQCKPNLVFDNEGKVVALIINNQIIPENLIDIQDIPK